MSEQASDREPISMAAAVLIAKRLKPERERAERIEKAADVLLIHTKHSKYCGYDVNPEWCHCGLCEAIEAYQEAKEETP